MDLNVCKKMDENKQSEHMNDAAIAFVEKQYPAYKGSVRPTSK